jgi:hypothetical protein
MKKRNEENIKKTLQSFVDQKQISKGYYQSSIQKVWKDLMGDMVAEYTSSIRISGDKLILQFTSAPLKQEFVFKKEKLIAMINDRMGKEVIKEVIIK